MSEICSFEYVWNYDHSVENRGRFGCICCGELVYFCLFGKSSILLNWYILTHGLDCNVKYSSAACKIGSNLLPEKSCLGWIASFRTWRHHHLSGSPFENFLVGACCSGYWRCRHHDDFFHLGVGIVKQEEERSVHWIGEHRLHSWCFFWSCCRWGFVACYRMGMFRHMIFLNSTDQIAEVPVLDPSTACFGGWTWDIFQYPQVLYFWL